MKTIHEPADRCASETELAARRQAALRRYLDRARGSVDGDLRRVEGGAPQAERPRRDAG